MKPFLLLPLLLLSSCTATFQSLETLGNGTTYDNPYPSEPYNNYTPEYAEPIGTPTHEFQRFLDYLSTQPRPSDREKSLRLFVRHTTLTCQQGATLLRMTPLPKERLRLLRIIAPAIVDMRNAHEMLRLFPHDVREAQRILETNGPLPQRPTYRPQPDAPHYSSYRGVMSPSEFDRFLLEFTEESFSSGKERLIQRAIRNHRFTCQQAALLLRTNDFDTHRNTQLRLLAPYLVDLQNTHFILNAYEFAIGRQDAQRILDNSAYISNPNNNIHPLNPQFQSPMSDANFSTLLRNIEKAAFNSDKESLVQTATAHNYFTCQQTHKILSTVNFDDDRLKLLRLLAPRITDPEHFHTLLPIFSFSSSRNDAQQIFDALLHR